MAPLQHRSSGSALAPSLSPCPSASSGHENACEVAKLKVRLQELQLKLHPLLVQIKLAWRRCSTKSRSSLHCASHMVQLGEHLTANLRHAFDVAVGTASVPLTAYRTLVERIEADLATFQSLVANVARGHFPLLPVHLPDEKGTINDQDKDVPLKMSLKRYDLPSMETYCKHVAPPYSSYVRKHHGRPKRLA